MGIQTIYELMLWSTSNRESVTPETSTGGQLLALPLSRFKLMILHSHLHLAGALIVQSAQSTLFFCIFFKQILIIRISPWTMYSRYWPSSEETISGIQLGFSSFFRSILVSFRNDNNQIINCLSVHNANDLSDARAVLLPVK